MKLKEVFEESSFCKICKKKCDVSWVFKEKPMVKYGIPTLEKKKTGRVHLEPRPNQLASIEMGPYGIKLSEFVLDLETEKLSITVNEEIKNYPLQSNYFVLINFTCNTPVIDYHTDEKRSDSDDKYMKFSSTEDSLMDISGHYHAEYVVEIDGDTKLVSSCAKVSESMENDDFSIEKSFLHKRTKIIKKQKTINLSFIYDKHLEDIEFDKLIDNLRLLK